MCTCVHVVTFGVLLTVCNTSSHHPVVRMIDAHVFVHVRTLPVAQINITLVRE